MGAETNDVVADGEVVWSLRLGAGVKFCGREVGPDRARTSHIRKTTVTKKPDHRGATVLT